MGENFYNNDNNMRRLNDENEGGGRRALGDVTNNLGQRGVGSISRSSLLKSISGSKRSAEDSDGDTDFLRQVSVVVDKFEKKRCGTAKCAKVGGCSEIGLSPLKGGKTYRLQNLSGDGRTSSPSGSREAKVRGESALDRIDLCESRGVVDVVDVDEVGTRGDVSSECCQKDVNVGASGQVGGLGEKAHLLNVVSVDKVVKEGGFLSACCDKDDNVGASARDVDLGEKGHLLNVDDVNKVVKEGGVSSESGEVEKEGLGEETRGFSDERDSDSGLSRRAMSDIAKGGFDCAVTSRLKVHQKTASFGLERCTFLKGEGSGSGMVSLKHCSCSFCTKAAYIWSDLQYQDAKGRLSILAKSQKEASNLAQKYSADNEMGRTPGPSGKVAHVDTDLGGRWKSLFLQMESVYGTESSQLQTSFLALKDIREDYKTKLEAINGMPSDMQQCSSEASDHS